MSDDFIHGLQGDLVEAMDRYERRGRFRRLSATLRPPRWRTTGLLQAATIAALLACVVVAAQTFQPSPPPLRPHVVAQVAIGGTPMDAVLAGGSLWATDFTGSVVRVDPATHRVIRRIEVPSGFGPIAADAGSVWLRSAPYEGCYGGLQLTRIDIGSGRITLRRGVIGGNGLAAAGGAVWVPRCSSDANGIDRRDSSGAVTATVPIAGADAVVTGGGSLWALTHDGTVVQADPTSARVIQRHPRLAPLADPTSTGAKALAPDGAGVWVISSGRATIFHVTQSGVVRRIRVDAAAQPLLVKARDGLWFAAADRLGGHHRLERIDPDSGRVTAQLDLGHRRPVALVPFGDQLCVLTANGAVLFVR